MRISDEELKEACMYAEERPTHAFREERAYLDLEEIRKLARAVVHCRAKLIRAKEEESLRSQPSVRRVDDARFELTCSIEALKIHLEDKP